MALRLAHSFGRNRRMRYLVQLAISVALIASHAEAHDPGLSTTQVTVGPKRLEITVGFAPSDLRTLLPATQRHIPAIWSQSDFAAWHGPLLTLAPNLLAIDSLNGPLPWSGLTVDLASSNSVLFHFTAERPAAGQLTLRSLVMDRLPPGHRDYMSVTDAQGVLLQEKLISASDLPLAFTLPMAAGALATAPPLPAPTPHFWEFLRLGIFHIWTGYDHLLFLFGLLIVCRSFRAIVGIISCFTIAHSITLALATLNVVTLPSRLVEPMIAASICYVGVENLLRGGAEPTGRWALTFGFGLIHGFGFATVLRDLGVGTKGHGLALPLFTFNLGVEVGQITIAALVLPLVWQLRKHPAFLRYGVPILSAVVSAAGLYWFLQRTIFA